MSSPKSSDDHSCRSEPQCGSTRLAPKPIYSRDEYKALFAECGCDSECFTGARGAVKPKSSIDIARRAISTDDDLREEFVDIYHWTHRDH